MKLFNLSEIQYFIFCHYFSVYPNEKISWAGRLFWCYSGEIPPSSYSFCFRGLPGFPFCSDRLVNYVIVSVKY
jgi:hypothetical protein